MENLVSGIAAILTTVALFPQAMRIIRNRETRALSLHTYMILTVGVGFWLAFGVMISNWPMIITNVIMLGQSATILAMKLRYG